jgi:hypothetical protein
VRALPVNTVVPEKFVMVIVEATPEPEALRVPAVIE